MYKIYILLILVQWFRHSLYNHPETRLDSMQQSVSRSHFTGWQHYFWRSMHGLETGEHWGLPVKINSMLSHRFLLYFCRYRRIVVASNFTDNLGFFPFCRFFSAIICSLLTSKWSFRGCHWKFLCLSVRVCPYLYLSVPFSYVVICHIAQICCVKIDYILQIFMTICCSVLMPLHTKIYTISRSRTNLSHGHFPYPAVHPSEQRVWTGKC